MSQSTDQVTDQRRGLYVFIALAVLTAVEFGVSTALANALFPLLLIAFVKAGLIVYYFMHLMQLWRQEAHQ